MEGIRDQSAYGRLGETGEEIKDGASGLKTAEKRVTGAITRSFDTTHCLVSEVSVETITLGGRGKHSTPSSYGVSSRS